MPAMLVLLLSLVAAAKIPFEEQALVAGTKWNLSNLLFLDIYGVSMVEFLVLTSLDQLIFILKILFIFLTKASYLNEEVNSPPEFHGYSRGSILILA